MLVAVYFLGINIGFDFYLQKITRLKTALDQSYGCLKMLVFVSELFLEVHNSAGGPHDKEFFFSERTIWTIYNKKLF